MKRVILAKWRDPESFTVEDIDKPTPEKSEILIKIKASSVTAGDCEIRKLKLPLGLSLPIRIYAGWKNPKRLKVLGQEFSGIVEQVGKDVTRFKVGDEVFGTTGFTFGAYSQYICRPAEPKDMQGVIDHKPINMTFEESSVIPTAGMEALHYLHKSSLKSGHKLLIIGAGGSIGTLTLQLAKSRGIEVTVVDREEKLDMLKALGSDRCIDCTDKDFWRSAYRFDLIIDVVGKKTVRKGLRLLKKGGDYYLAFAKISHLWFGLFVKLFLRKNLSVQASDQTPRELQALKNSVETGTIKPIIDQLYPLEDTAKAHSYADSGLKKGNIVIQMD